MMNKKTRKREKGETWSRSQYYSVDLHNNNKPQTATMLKYSPAAVQLSRYVRANSWMNRLYLSTGEDAIWMLFYNMMMKEGL
jgi:hypothetical protein